MPLFHTNFYAKSLHTLTNLMVTIPAAPRWETSGLSFDEIYRMDKKYPVLYLLHGMHAVSYTHLICNTPVPQPTFPKAVPLW